MNRLLCLPIFFITSLIHVCDCAVEITSQKLAPVEIKLFSSRTYTNPNTDVRIVSQFMHANRTIIIRGFWDGDSIWKIRFSPPDTGQWSFFTSCSDTSNVGLHNIIGHIAVEPYEGTSQFRRKGWFSVASGARYLCWGDGEPFFWLGCTAWEITWKSYLDQVQRYISDRKTKGFNVLQVVVFSHQIFNYTITNRYNQTFFLNNDFTRINPQYCQYLDTIVKIANDSDMAVGLVPLWAYYSEVHRDSTFFPWGSPWYALNDRESMVLANYLGARYAGSNVFWILGGDNYYNSPERSAFWTEFAESLKIASGQGLHLMTIHRGGDFHPFSSLNNSTAWIDYQVFQSGHDIGLRLHVQNAQEGYALMPIKPVLNAEPCYEDIFNAFWKYTDAFSTIDTTKTFRIQPKHVRMVAYESVLSGALMGLTYGANGIWQWHTQELESVASHWPRVFVDSAWLFPGSNDMTVFKKFFIRHDWYSLIPLTDVQVFGPDSLKLCVAANTHYCIAFFPQHSGTTMLRMPLLNDATSFVWFSPVTGDTTMPQSLSIQDSMYNFTPPDSSDWLLVLTHHFNIELDDASSLQRKDFISQSYPNPFNAQTNIVISLVESKKVTVKLYSIHGELTDVILDCVLTAGRHIIPIQGRSLSSGCYMLKGSIGTHQICNKIILVK